MALGNEQFLFMLQVWFRHVASPTNTPFTLAVQTGLELALTFPVNANQLKNVYTQINQAT